MAGRNEGRITPLSRTARPHGGNQTRPAAVRPRGGRDLAARGGWGHARRSSPRRDGGPHAQVPRETRRDDHGDTRVFRSAPVQGTPAARWTCPERADTSDVGVSPRGGSPDGEEGGGERGRPAAAPSVHAGVQG